MRWVAKPVPPEPRRYSAALQDAQRVLASVTKEWASHPDEFEAEVDEWEWYAQSLCRGDREDCLRMARMYAYRMVAFMQHARDLDREGAG